MIMKPYIRTISIMKIFFELLCKIIRELFNGNNNNEDQNGNGGRKLQPVRVYASR